MVKTTKQLGFTHQLFCSMKLLTASSNAPHSSWQQISLKRVSPAMGEVQKILWYTMSGWWFGT